MRARRPVLLLALLLALVPLVPGAQAWTAGYDRPHHADLAEAAAGRLPTEQREWLLARLDDYRQGALDPDGVTDPARRIDEYYHGYEAHDDSGGGAYMLQRTLRDAVLALREDAPDAAYRLGVMTHFATDLAMPMHTGHDERVGLSRVDLMHHRWHERIEHEAYDRLRDVPLAEGPAPAPVPAEGVRAHIVETATRSAALRDPLMRALHDSGGAWSPEVDAVMRAAVALSAERAAQMLATAFALAEADEAQLAALDPSPYAPGAWDRLEEMALERPETPLLVPVALGGALLLRVAISKTRRALRSA